MRGTASEPGNFKMAEREGFEPSVPALDQYGGLANHCFQPLSHLSRGLSEYLLKSDSTPPAE